MELLILGDLCISGEPENLILQEQGYDLWSGIRSLIGKDTFVIANLECAITEEKYPKPFKWATLKSSPQCVKALMPLQVACIGNNHISDFGEFGAQDTIAHLGDAGILTVGYGSNLKTALQPAVLVRDGLRIAVVSLSCPTTNGENLATYMSPGVVPLGSAMLKQSILSARSQADVVLVYLHWGVEQSHDPVPDQIRLAHWAVDWGADAVIGSHAHTIQSFERYHDRWIFYGLGNFLFGPVNTQYVNSDGFVLRGVQEQALCNRQSLAVKFEILSRDSDACFKLLAIYPIIFDRTYVPRLISLQELALDLEEHNRRLALFCSRHREELESDREPIFNSWVHNGLMAYGYSHPPICDEDDVMVLGWSKRYIRRLSAYGARLLGR